MPHLLKTTIVSFFLAVTLPLTLVAQTINTNTSNDSCLRLSGTVDAWSGKSDVIKIQNFLKNQGFFNGTVSGLFDTKTQTASKLFQLKKFSNVNVADIDVTLLPNRSVRQSIASKGFVIRSTGIIDTQTRAKLLYVTCKKANNVTTSSSGRQNSAPKIATNPLATESIDTGIGSTVSWLYGYYYLDYDASNNDLNDLATYTNFGSAKSVEQVSLLANKGFKNIMYVALFSDSLSKLLVQEGISAPSGTFSTYDFRTIPDYENKILSIYKEDMVTLRDRLIASGGLDSVTDFLIVDEPALHRNYIPNQAFLEKVETTFKVVFPGKKSSMAFAEDVSDPTSVSRGAHLLPPQSLDVIIVDPYFFGKTYIGCSQAEIRKFLYTDNPNSTIDWAKQFNKPIYVAADAMLTNGAMLPECYYKETYNLIKQDSQIQGLLWFIYDKTFIEGPFSGTASNSQLVDFLKGLTVKPTVTLNPFSPSTIEAGKTSTLSFTSTNAETCTGQGIWNGDLGGTHTNPQGATTPVMNIPGTYTQTVTCTNLAGSTTSETRTLTVIPKVLPEITLTLNPFSPSTIEAGKTSTLSFTSTNAETCTGQGIWNGDLGGTHTNPQGATTPVMNIPGIYTQTVTCEAPGLVSKTATRLLTVIQSEPQVGAVTAPPVTFYGGESLSTMITSGTIDATASIRIHVAFLTSPYSDSYYLSVAYEDQNNNGDLTWYQKGPFTQDISGTPASLGMTPGTYYFKVKTCNTANVCSSFDDSLVAKLVVKANPLVLGVSISSTCTNLPINLHRGMEKPSVSRLQSFLLKKGLLEGEITGFYGDKTVEAVKDYQASVGLPVTGMVYDFTREAIRAESCQ